MRKITKRLALLTLMAAMTISASGCLSPIYLVNPKLAWGYLVTTFEFGAFWWTTPLIPVSPYFSQEIEDTYWEEERYGKVPILDPVEGEHAPLFCLDPPSKDEVIRSLPDKAAGGLAFFAETRRNNIRIVVEPIVDRLDECRFYPLVGPARLHHCHYKCTVYYDKVKQSDWPVPFIFEDQTVDVVYIDHDHLIRCAGPPTPQ